MSFYIVGDPDQLLYRFAGATPESNLFDGFENEFPDGQLFKLETNYRSTKAIIEAGKRLIAHNYQVGNGPYDNSYIKNLSPRPDAPDGEPVTFSWFDTPEEEAASVAADIRIKLDQGAFPGEFFVGSRTRAQLAYLEGEFVKSKIPYINLCGGSFWTQSHIAATVAYLRLAADESDNVAFEKVYNIASNLMVAPWGKSQGEYCNHRFLGKAFLTACGGQYKRVLYAVESRRAFAPGVEDLVAFVQEVQAEIAHSENMGQVIRYIIDSCIAKWVKSDEGNGNDDPSEDGKLDDLAIVIELAKQFNNPKAFTDYVEEMVKADLDKKNKDWSDYVVISTIHRLKGLEREYVYGLGWCEGKHAKSGEPRGLLPHTFSLTEPPQTSILPTSGKGRIEDERCIAFVLVTRAKLECHLSGCASYNGANMLPSRFVAELGLNTKGEQ